MTASVCKKCRFFSVFGNSCTLTRSLKMPWDDACASYELKPELDYKVKRD